MVVLYRETDHNLRDELLFAEKCFLFHADYCLEYDVSCCSHCSFQCLSDDDDAICVMCAAVVGVMVQRRGQYDFLQHYGHAMTL